ncbi:MBL fold metallo-hydrolase [Sneathiella sp. P13V-1]|uniref:MBL fold metallo-hydrolase n=1 Tax=Sneathiella sp. P13V-1 TaxID=2697366 RepID=UPI00187B4A5A|nr:MBL fold metallo-hydrolase [Sneathiella sp. P13V-1]MBE7635337.1 MBL fold metallo-hydrolase [Sneathiella sp. P13V-1]
MNTWNVGNVKITRIVEIEMAGGTRFVLPDATPEAVLPIKWLAPHFMTEEGKLIMSIHALVVDTGDKRIIIDTCVGNDKERVIPSWNKMQTRFLEDLEEAGYPRESIDMVFCTHMHVDHVGWNTMLVDGEWVPTFPNAKYLFADKEWEHWQAASQEEFGAVIEDSVQPIVDAGLAEFVPCDAQLCPELKLLPTPGHTPGHVSVDISSNGQKALITGDMLHHPCQMARLDWASAPDHDKALAKLTRRTVFESVADTDVLVIGTHFATPSAGHVKKEADGSYRLEVFHS